MARMIKARTEFANALKQVSAERGIKPDLVIDAIKQAVLAAFRKDAGVDEDELSKFEAKIDLETGTAHILDKKGKDITPPGFGRIATQTAKQVILQGVREAEKNAIIREYQGRVGSVVNGMVLRFEGKTAIIDVGRAQAIMPPEEQAGGEYYRLNQRLAVYIKEIKETPRGEKVVVSRSAPELIKELFAREVPEVSSGSVKIVAVAREAGRRSKVAVDSAEEGVDPVGSCVGKGGVRVQAVIGQLGGERVDIIPFSKNLAEFIKSALAPAEGLTIQLFDEEKRAVVEAPEDQQPIAIGTGGQNVRLASILTGWTIDVRGAKKPPVLEKKKKTAKKKAPVKAKKQKLSGKAKDAK